MADLFGEVVELPAEVHDHGAGLGGVEVIDFGT